MTEAEAETLRSEAAEFKHRFEVLRLAYEKQEAAIEAMRARAHAEGKAEGRVQGLHIGVKAAAAWVEGATWLKREAREQLKEDIRSLIPAAPEGSGR